MENDERQIIDSIIGGNKTFDEVAEMLNVGIRTVYRRMRKAITKIERRIDEKHNTK